MVARAFQLLGLLALLAMPVQGQNVVSITNNVMDLNRERDRLWLPAGDTWIRAKITVGPTEAFKTRSTTGWVLRVTRRIDLGTNNLVTPAAIIGDPDGTVRWYIPALQPGQYRLQSTVYAPNDTVQIMDRWLDVTNSPVEVSVVGGSVGGGGGGGTSVFNIVVAPTVSVAGVAFSDGAFSNTFITTVEAGIDTVVVENVSVDTVNAGDVIASGNVSILGGLYAAVTNFFAPVINFSITNIINVGSIENLINNYVYNTNIVYMENNIGGVQVFQSNTLSIGTVGSTNTPGFLRFYSGNDLATSVVDGANQSIYLPGGGGGMATNIVGVYPVVVSNYLGTTYIGMITLSGGVIVTPDATSTTIVQYISAVPQAYSVPLTVTQITAYAWGAAGAGYGAAGGAGGFTVANIPVVGGEVLDLYIGQGGQRGPTSAVASVTSTSPASFFGGGSGLGRLIVVPTGGGGLTGIKRGTNWLIIAGGGGGASGGNTVPVGGAGGGSSGGQGTASTSESTNLYAGRGGTLTAGGSNLVLGAVSAGVPWAVTNTPGDHVLGGNGGITTNWHTSTAAGAAGGGGGWFGGTGGAVHAPGGGVYAGGGGGSGYYNPSYTIGGQTLRGYTAASVSFPPAQDLPFYVAGVGVGSTSANGGPGLIVITSNNPAP